MSDDGEAVEVPARYSRVDPWVISEDTDAEIEFLAAAFAGRETPGSRMRNPNGRIGHVEVEIGEAVLLMFDADPNWPPYPAHLRIYVADAQIAFEHALAAGAREVTRPTDLAFGERIARVRDPQGHLWWIHQRVEDVTPDELAARFAESSAMAAMVYVQDSLSRELSAARDADAPRDADM